MSLLAFYHEIVFYRKMFEVKEVAEIINKIAEADSLSEASKFTDKDISFFFHSLSYRVDMLKP